MRVLAAAGGAAPGSKRSQLSQALLLHSGGTSGRRKNSGFGVGDEAEGTTVDMEELPIGLEPL